MNDNTTKTSKEWLEWYDKEYNCETMIIDYDGWDRRNLDCSFNEERITLDEYLTRLTRSTIQIQQNLNWK